MRRLALWTAIVLALFAGSLFVAQALSPWPGVLAIRLVFGQGAAAANAALAPHLPRGLTEHLDLAYGPEPRERLDLRLPPGPAPPAGWPVILWVHGGAFVSGDKSDVGNYLRILSGKGYATLAPNYSRGPDRLHPRPTDEMLEALLWAQAAAPRYGLDAERILLAGDSAGAHIALQTAMALIDPAYAESLRLRPLVDPARLRGLILFCGIYELPADSGNGLFGAFLRTAARAYLGQRDPTPDLRASFGLIERLPANLPPVFISAGNADPLLAQSQALAQALAARGIALETLFFPPDHVPPLGHEYQFTLDAAGKTALDRLTAFLARTTRP